MAKFNKTHLSIDQAEVRGFIHRDYIAHCLRWTYAAKLLNQQHRYKTARILDIGCGKEIPLAKLLYTSKMSPTEGIYTAVDLNLLTVPDTLRAAIENQKFSLELHGNLDVSDDLFITAVQRGYTFVVCFEVLEHMPPENVIRSLQNIRLVVDHHAIILISTPNYDSKTGAAGNHPNEMKTELVQWALAMAGFEIQKRYGTFASIRDYENFLQPEVAFTFNKLRDYYDTNYLATILAPLYPDHSRNVLYVCAPSTPTYISLKWEPTLSNNDAWRDIL